MPNAQTTPRAGALSVANLIQTQLAASKVRLFKADWSPSIFSLPADFAANEATYSGYPAGGLTVATWSEPLYDPAGGASIMSGLLNFAVVTASPIVGNTIGGWWLLDSTGDLFQYGTFGVQPVLSQVGDGIPLSIKINVPMGTA